MRLIIFKYKRYKKSILTKGVKKPCKELTTTLQKHSGRNNTGQITVRHKGAGVKRKYRNIAFKRSEGEAFVKTIEYDPYRNAFICLIKGENILEYIIHVEGLKVGDKIICNYSEGVENEIGNCTCIGNIQIRTYVNCVSLYPNARGSIARSAGTYAEILSQDRGGYTLIKMLSGITTYIPKNSVATIGSVSNSLFSTLMYYKAGTNRRLGIRSSVRGVAMATGHKHAGGEGKGGTKCIPVGPSGAFSKGTKTVQAADRRRAKYIIGRRQN